MKFSISTFIERSGLKALIPDKLYLKMKYKKHLGYDLNLKNPVTFTEKIQWLKLYDRKPLYTILVDKYEVKKYVSNIIGDSFVIPTYGVWNRVEDIDIDKLPEKFVLKCTHDSGGLIICRDKSKFDIEKSKEFLKKSLQRNYFLCGREWPYKNVKHRIIAEKYLEEESSDNINVKDLTDYKFYCFDGIPIFCQIIRDRSTMETIDFYDMEWNHMPFVGLNPVGMNPIKNGKYPVEKPKSLQIMKDICKKLSENIPFLRVDLYEVNGLVYFGELTFYPASGMGSFTPNEWNKILGDLIKLPID